MSGTDSRRWALRAILSEQVVTSQSELARLLAERGFQVTQATVSRDLRAVGAAKTRSADGTMRYVWEAVTRHPDTVDALATALASFSRSIQASGNLVVIKTHPGAAHVVAGAIDGARLDGVLGTVAGDDTMLIVTDEASGGRMVAESIEEIGAGG